MEFYKIKQLGKIALMEQDMSTGFDLEKKEIKTQNIISAMPDIFTDPLIT
jgi:hypothetical protein